MVNLLQAADLHRLLHNGLLCAAKNDNLPMIELVRLEFTAGVDGASGQVLSIATDRYILGVTRAAYDGDDNLVIQLARADAENLVKLAKTSPRVHGRLVHVSVTENGKRAAFAFTTGEALSVEVSGESMPKVRALIPEEPRDAEGQQHFGLSANRIAGLTKILSEDRVGHLSFTFQGEGKPLLVKIGDDFIGALMTGRGHYAFTRPWWFTEPAAEIPDAVKDTSTFVEHSAA